MIGTCTSLKYLRLKDSVTQPFLKLLPSNYRIALVENFLDILDNKYILYQLIAISSKNICISLYH